MAQWELHDGQAQVGPLDEDHVLRMIAHGIPAETVVRRVGEPDWRSLRSHPAFAVALERKTSAPVAAPPAVVAGLLPVPAKPAMSRQTIALVAGGAVAVVAVVVALAASMRGSSGSAPNNAPLPPAAAVPVQREDPAKPNPLDEIMAKTTTAEAFKVARPLMVEKFNDTSPGAFLFALWSMKNLRWRDVSATGDETSFARVQKDVDAERGKRICFPGTIIQIEATKQPYGTLYIGLMESEASNLFHFLAVRSTGDLVQRSYARFCGFVTGKFDYSNSGGGTGHAVDMVGMFDLPQNRSTK
jgi:hypothetical protein